MKRLSAATLGQLPRHIRRPAYDRSRITAGIVHLGLGAFHRAHQAVCIDDCLAAGETGWAITAASLRHPDSHQALAPQDGLYTFAARESDREELRVVGSLIRTLVAPHDPAALLAAIAAPETRLVTLTITEKGYCADMATARLRLADPDIQHDLANPHAPRTALGYLAYGMKRRMLAGTAAPTLLSCDNLPSNGKLLRAVLLEFCALHSGELARYVEQHVATPSCMVDRIVPATTPQDRDAVSQQLGLRDEGAVTAEPFFQWVIEDRFSARRPRLEAYGVEFVPDVVPYEHMKLRLLNGAHSAIAAMGLTCGLVTVAETIENPVFRDFVKAYWKQVIATLPRELNSGAYTAQLLQRFSNRALHHKTAQIATDASQKLPQRMLAPLGDLLAAGKSASHVIFALAAWLRSCDGQDEAGTPMPLDDPMLAQWAERPAGSTLAAALVDAYLARKAIFGAGLAQDASFRDALTAMLSAIREQGMIEAARQHLARG